MTIKKVHTKIITFVILFEVLTGTAFCATAEAATVSKSVYPEKAEQVITTQATEYVWLVKKVNGIAYKRQFNRTTGQWVGDWTRIQAETPSYKENPPQPH